MAIESAAVPKGAVASIFGNEFQYVNLREGLAGLPQVIGIFATYDPLKTGVAANEPIRVFSDTEAGEKFGFGFPAHLAARQTLKKSGVVPVFIFPIAEAGGAVAADGEILVAGTATKAGTASVYIAGQRLGVAVAKGALPAAVATDIVAAINANINLPVTAVVNGVTAEQVDITSKYLGAIADDITVTVNISQFEVDAAPESVTYTITTMTNGAGVPTVTGALNEFGDTWVTYVVNTFGGDSAVLDEFSDFNETYRWDPLVQKFFRAFWGAVDPWATVTAITDARKLDRTNGNIPSPAAYSLPLELAALGVGAMAARNQNNPAQPYTGLLLDGLTPGVPSDQWVYTERDAAIKAGSSTTLLLDGEIQLEDITTHYHKTGEEPPAYRWAVDIAKLAEWAFNVSLVFEGDNWRGKILIDDGDVVTNPEARRPLDGKAEIFKLADAASAAAIITKPATTKENTVAGIDSQNPNRLNIRTLIVLSGATRVISLTTNFGFNFGALAE